MYVEFVISVLCVMYYVLCGRMFYVYIRYCMYIEDVLCI